MNVDVGFSGIPRSNVVTSARPKLSASTLAEMSSRKHERTMEFRHRVETLNQDLASAMNSLASANADIDRLNLENERLKSELALISGELKQERERNLKTSKKTKGPHLSETCSPDSH